MKTQWTLDNMPDQTGKVIVVTGTTSGLGYETTKALAQKNATVITCARRLETCKAQATDFETLGGGEVFAHYLDLGDLASVRAFAEKILAQHDKLDILINNAGVMAVPYGKTKDGFERHIGVNYIGHWVLTALLMPLISATPGARVVNVTSNAELAGYIPMLLRDFNQEKFYERWISYGHSKQANIMFTYELQRRFEVNDVDARAMAAHPGFAQTHLRASRDTEPNIFYRASLKFFEMISRQSAAMGALPVLYAATDPEAEGAAFYGVEGLLQISGYPRRRRTTRRSYNQEVMRKLWERTEELTGVEFKVG